MIPNQALTCEKGSTFSFEIDMQDNTDLTGASGSWILAESWFDGAKILLTKPLAISFDAGIWKASVQLNPADTLTLPIGTFFHDSKVALGDGTIGHVSSGTFVLDTRTVSESLECDRGDNFLFEIDVADADLTNAIGTWTLAESWFDGARVYITKTNGSGLFIDALAKKVVVQLVPQDTIGVSSGTLFHSCDVTLNDGTVGRIASGPFILNPSVDIAVVPTTSAHATQTLGALGQTTALTSPRAIAAAQQLGSLGQAATATAGGGVTPSFQTDFTAISSLPTGVSLSRASNATMFDSTGKLTYAPNNLFTNSNDFSNADWQKSGTASVTGGFADPVGGSSATRLDLPGINDSIGQFVSPFPAKAIHSVWVRSDTAGTIHLLDGSGGAWNVSVSVGTTWTLVDTGPQTQTVSLVRVIRESGDLASLYIYNQVLAAVTYETSARSADQVITTSAAYYGPRFDHNPISPFAATGPLIEDQRTNLMLQSGNLADPAWSTSNNVTPPVITANAATAPDGTTTAAQVVFSAVTDAGTYSSRYQGVSVTANVNEFAIWLKGFVGGEQLYLFCTPDASTFVRNRVTLTTNWQRFSIAPTTTAATWFFEIGCDLRDGSQTSTGAQTIFAWGAQVELGAFPTSYIPTTTAAVIRRADIAQLTGAALTAAASAAVSFIIETDSIKNIAGNQRVLGFNGSSGPGIFISADNTVGTYNNASVKTSTIGSGGTYSGGIVRSASSGDGSGRSVVANGGTVATDGNVLTTAPITAVYLGSDSVTAIDGWIRSLAIYTSRLSDADLQTKSVVGAAF